MRHNQIPINLVETPQEVAKQILFSFFYWWWIYIKKL